MVLNGSWQGACSRKRRTEQRREVRQAGASSKAAARPSTNVAGSGPSTVAGQSTFPVASTPATGAPSGSSAVPESLAPAAGASAPSATAAVPESLTPALEVSSSHAVASHSGIVACIINNRIAEITFSSSSLAQLFLMYRAHPMTVAQMHNTFDTIVYTRWDASVHFNESTLTAFVADWIRDMLEE